MKSYVAARGETSGDWTCPSNYEVKSGLNIDFPHKGMKRAFVVYPPADLSKAAPVWVPLTGSVESTRDNLTVARSGANALMAEKGFMVIGPVPRVCETGPLASGRRVQRSRQGWLELESVV
jgi:poly(3-hydroxybutyrate) depolymerase